MLRAQETTVEGTGQPQTLALHDGKLTGPRRPHSFAESVFDEGPAGTRALDTIADTDDDAKLRRGLVRRIAKSKDESGMEEEQDVRGAFGAVSSQFGA